MGKATRLPGINIFRNQPPIFSLAAYRYSSRDYRTFNDHVWANNRDNYRRDDDDIYDIADYYENDFGRKKYLHSQY